MRYSTMIICSGFHSLGLTEQFLFHLKSLDPHLSYLIFPTNCYPAYSAWHLEQFIRENIPNLSNHSLLFIGFSAGVVAAFSTAIKLQFEGIKIQGLIAFDGWGVPLLANFPLFRLSHDAFTHYTSEFLGTGKMNFYADPAVDHLTFWQSPHCVRGWQIEPIGVGSFRKIPITLMDFLKNLLNYYKF